MDENLLETAVCQQEVIYFVEGVPINMNPTYLDGIFFDITPKDVDCFTNKKWTIDKTVASEFTEEQKKYLDDMFSPSFAEKMEGKWIKYFKLVETKYYKEMEKVDGIEN